MNRSLKQWMRFLRRCARDLLPRFRSPAPVPLPLNPRPSALRRLGGDRGMTLVELMAAVSIMGVTTLGLVLTLLVQARQMTRDKLLNDMYVYAHVLLDEADQALSGATVIQPGANAGGSAVEELEFNFSGIYNLGQTYTTRFQKQGDRNVRVSGNQGAESFSLRWPPPELDPDRHRNLRVKVEVMSFKITHYNRRQYVNPRVAGNLWEIDMTMRLTEKDTGYQIEKDFSRVIFSPNREIALARAQQSSGQLQ